MRLRLLLPLLFFLSLLSFSQTILNEEGDLLFLKGEKTIMLEFDYEKMRVAKFEKEEDYVKNKVAEYEGKQKGDGERWKTEWISARKTMYEPQFEEQLNLVVGKIGLSASQSKAGSKYSLVVRTTFVEPGYYNGVFKQTSSLNVQYIFVETGDKNKVMAKFLSTRIHGSDVTGLDFDAGARIVVAYAKAGTLLGKYLVEELKAKK